MARTSELAGTSLLPWQLEMIADWSAHDGRGGFVHRRCGASIPRQAGKSDSGVAWAVFLAAVLGYSVLWTDHNYSTTCEMLRRFKDVFGAKANDPAARLPDFNRAVSWVNNKTAQEAIHLKNGGMICFSTRTKSAALGYSFDVVVYDEAQELTGEQMQAILPTTTSGPHGNMQALFLGTPTRAGSSAEVFQDVRDEARGNPADDLCWTEYGVAEVGDVSDERRWGEANPSVGLIANIEAIRAASRTMDSLAFAQEYMGYWLPQVASALVSAATWGKLAVPDSEVPPEGEGLDAFGVKFSPDGSTVALAAACKRDGFPVYVELLDVRPTSGGIGWLADCLADVSRRGACVAVDGKSGAGSLVERLSGRVPRGFVVPVRAGDAVTAAAMMLDAVNEGTVAHNGSPALEASATTCTRRRIGSSGGWGWGGDDSAPMEAASLALWAVRTTKRNPARKQVVW